jgi:hypothetical protein
LFNLGWLQPDSRRVRLGDKSLPVSVVDIGARRNPGIHVQGIPAAQFGQNERVIPLYMPGTIFQAQVHNGFPLDIAHQDAVQRHPVGNLSGARLREGR